MMSSVSHLSHLQPPTISSSIRRSQIRSQSLHAFCFSPASLNLKTSRCDFGGCRVGRFHVVHMPSKVVAFKLPSRNFRQSAPYTHAGFISAVFLKRGRKYDETMTLVIIIFVLLYRTLVFCLKTSVNLPSNFRQDR